VDEKAVERFRSDVVEPISPEPPWVIAGTWVARPTAPSDGAHASTKPASRRTKR
jgi:hypothetical protein